MEQATTGQELTVQPQQQNALSDQPTNGLTTSLSKAVELLQPCGAKTGTAELTSCLTLVAPTGMSEAERKNWLNVARITLRGIPEDLLRYGCQQARLKADHPAKVIPEIMKAVGLAWHHRKRHRDEITRELEAANAPRLEAPGAVPHEETQRILREVAEQVAAERGEGAEQ